MPSVVTIAVIPTRLTSRPVTRPATSAAPNASASATGTFPESPFGYRVMMTTVREIIPGTERSMPPCWITSVCPTATIARIAANGSIPSSELCRTLSGSSTRLTRNSSAVPITMPVAPPSFGRRREPSRGSAERDGGVAVAGVATGLAGSVGLTVHNYYTVIATCQVRANERESAPGRGSAPRLSNSRGRQWRVFVQIRCTLEHGHQDREILRSEASLDASAEQLLDRAGDRQWDR